MRTFFGLSPSPKTMLAIEAWRTKAFPAFDAPVPAANFHITLAFLGQVTSGQQEQICMAADELSEIKEFDLSIDQVGYWSKPKALWLGSSSVADEHYSLAACLQKSARLAGINMAKQDYIPHLTLARKCAANPPAPLIEPDFKWKADAFHLYQSVSGKNGVTYPIRQSWPLAKRFTF